MTGWDGTSRSGRDGERQYPDHAAEPPDYLATDYILKEEIRIALDHLTAAGRSKRVFWVLLRPCNYEVYPDIAQYPVYPLKDKEALSGKARQKAISEHEDQDREWVKLLKMILDETE